MPSNNPFTVALYNETATLQTKHGMLVASTTYEDSGSGFDTTVNSVKYMIHNGTGAFEGKKWMTIYFFNNQPYKQRRIVIS
jgi:hypothetical protein